MNWWEWLLIWMAAYGVLSTWLKRPWIYDAIAGSFNLIAFIYESVTHGSMLDRIISAVIFFYFCWSFSRNWPNRKNKKRFAARLAGYKARAIQAKLKAAVQES